MKPKKSKLDQYADQLRSLQLEKKTLEEIRAWLKNEGLTVASSTLSVYLQSLRESQLQEDLLKQIASGAEQVKEVEAQFGKSPAPELETLVKLHRVLILQLSTQGNADPAFLRLADQLMRTAMEFVSGQTKAGHKERELRLAEDKFQIEFCEKILDQATREAAERIAGSNLSQADKIAAMRAEAFKDVKALQESGKLQIPKA